MTEQEQINELKDENSILEFQLKNRLDENVSLVEQTEALKAQVNRFKHGVESFNKTGSMNELLSAYIETPEQCIAEEQARAIESVREQIGLLQRYSFLALHQYPSVTKMPDQSGRWIDRNEVDDLIEKHINSLWEQAK